MTNPCTYSEKPRYSYAWAIEVIEELYGTYSRATEILSRVYDIYSSDLVELLVRNRPEYPIFRDIIHILDKWIHKVGEKKLISYLSSDTIQTYSALLRVAMISTPATGCTLLTRFREFLRLEEQGFKAGEGREAYADRSSPSFCRPRPLTRFLYDEEDDRLQGRLSI